MDGQAMKLVIAGGGTGGHLFPAIALAQEFTAMSPSNKVLFLCTERDIDRTELPRYGFEFKVLPSPRWMGALRSPLFALKMTRAIGSSLGILQKFAPHAVVGAGGYGAFPVIFAAYMQTRPAFLLEQNVLPGKTNRFLLKFAENIFIQWEASAKRLGRPEKAVLTGNPLRKEMASNGRLIALGRLGMTNHKTNLLVIGGSQGAGFLNEIMIATAPLLKEYADRLQLIHLTGPTDADKVRLAYEMNGLTFYVAPFSNDMQSVYSASDFALTRAGGTTIAELLHFGIPSIAVPYPRAAQDHQRYNAEELERLGAGMCCLQDELTPERLKETIKELVLSAETLGRMSVAAKTAAKPDAGKMICQAIAAHIQKRDPSVQ